MARFRSIAVLVVLAGVTLGVVPVLLALGPPARAEEEVALFEALLRRQTAPFTGLLAVDVLLGLVLGNLAIVTAAAMLWRWTGRGWRAWAGAVVTGGMAATLAGVLPGDILSPAFLLPPDYRPLAINYLGIASIEEGLKLVLLAGVLLPAEPVRDRRGLIAAALLVAVGFEIVENVAYLLPPVQLEEAVLGRLLVPRHLLFAAITAIGLCYYAKARRCWVLLATWLAAALAHGAFNVGVIVLTLRPWPPDSLEAQAFVLAFGVPPERLATDYWAVSASLQLAALGSAVVLAVLALRRMLRASANDPP